MKTKLLAFLILLATVLHCPAPIPYLPATSTNIPTGHTTNSFYGSGFTNANVNGQYVFAAATATYESYTNVNGLMTYSNDASQGGPYSGDHCMNSFTYVVDSSGATPHLYYEWSGSGNPIGAIGLSVGTWDTNIAACTPDTGHFLYTTNYSSIYIAGALAAQIGNTNTVWVDPLVGNDVSGLVGIASLPFATVGGAANALSAATTNGTIFLNPGHFFNGPSTINSGQSLIGSGRGVSFCPGTITCLGSNMNIANLSCGTINAGAAGVMCSNLYISNVDAFGAQDGIFIQGPYRIFGYNSRFGSPWDAWADFDANNNPSMAASSLTNSYAEFHNCEFINDAGLAGSAGPETLVPGQGKFVMYGGAIRLRCNQPIAPVAAISDTTVSHTTNCFMDFFGTVFDIANSNTALPYIVSSFYFPTGLVVNFHQCLLPTNIVNSGSASTVANFGVLNANGIATVLTNVTANLIKAGGYTNNTSYNVTAYAIGAVSTVMYASVAGGTNTPLLTNSSSPFPYHLAPGWAIVSASGLSGQVIPVP